MALTELLDELEIDKNFKMRPMNFEDHVYAEMVHEDGKFKGIRINGDTIKADKLESLLEAFGYAKHVFTICSQGLFDSLLRSFDRSTLFDLQTGYGIPTQFGELRYRRSALVLVVGTRTFYIWNLFKFFKFSTEEVNSLSVDKVEIYARMLFVFLASHKVSISNLYSPASVNRALMNEYSYNAFSKFHGDLDLLKAFYSACYGGRQESVGIGLKSGTHNYDMEKAHLRIISGIPSMRHTRLYKNKDYIPDAFCGAFLIRARVPRMEMCPLPYQPDIKSFVWNEMRQGGYPYGDIYGWYSSEYIKLLDEMGIKYDVHQSYQFVPLGKGRSPFSKLVGKVSAVLDDAPDHINAKALYHTLSGNMVSIRHRVDNNSRRLKYCAYNSFSPVLYSYILSYQSCYMYRLYNKYKAVAIRADAITALQKLPKTPRLRLDNTGDTMFFTSLLKTFPDGKGQIWKDLILEWKGSPYVKKEYSTFPTIGVNLRHGVTLGRRNRGVYSIFPSYGVRSGPGISDVADLLSEYFYSDPPTVEMIDKGFSGDN